MKNNYWLKLIILLVFSFGITSQVSASNSITVTQGYIKASIPGSDVTAAYMTINNHGKKAITLQKITSELSARIEIHQHSMANGMMTMRQVDQVIIKAKSKVVLQPSDLHLMIFSLKQKITEKDVISLTLHFTNATKIKIQLPVSKYK
ncbi:copper chaperone PCu(A)C [Colwellia sp. TT2012]|uniref:copper chaperone PCu(A)C n=1 Tax=Colwellia sp. TT2012 TaxID=1720342 RepID=UPI000709F6E9|nr:copper chaperone PCu(A)C [Colwellia sp. TT2012]